MANECWQRFWLNAEEVNIDIINVERHYRQPFNDFARQQRTTAGKTDAGLDVAGSYSFFVIFTEGCVVECFDLLANSNDQITFRFEVA
ncbi:Uncharacterised protein [Shigella sonnei]|nr:Uncharacterised protein [Shigella sonnei]CSQ70637.1 Uncharacterised protein [Shigella sonnei]CSR28412.1 Uncharacterised protein [Shigella sonnei]CSR94947.1 Uncharacterised protein [Shigella sonnei]